MFCCMKWRTCVRGSRACFVSKSVTYFAHGHLVKGGDLVFSYFRSGRKTYKIVILKMMRLCAGFMQASC